MSILVGGRGTLGFSDFTLTQAGDTIQLLTIKYLPANVVHR